VVPGALKLASDGQLLGRVRSFVLGAHLPKFVALGLALGFRRMSVDK
jgi:hypothetical protein